MVEGGLSDLSLKKISLRDRWVHWRHWRLGDLAIVRWMTKAVCMAGRLLALQFDTVVVHGCCGAQEDHGTQVRHTWPKAMVTKWRVGAGLLSRPKLQDFLIESCCRRNICRFLSYVRKRQEEEKLTLSREGTSVCPISAQCSWESQPDVMKQPIS